MRFARLRVAGPMIVVLGVLACDAPTATLLVPGSSARSVAPQATLGAEITALIAAGFPKGEATAIAARWDQVLRSIAKEPKVTLKGKLVPGSGGRAELVKLVKYIESKTSVSTPPTGETQAHFVARLVLDMSLYVYEGPTTPVPSVVVGSDVVLKVVQPTSTDTVVTPAMAAAVIFPVGAVSEPTVVVITPDTTYYPANCSGPLDTKLCQYPLFYKFNVFPDVRLNLPAKVQVCHVDAGTLRLPLANHNRFQVAHEKPADPANYSSGVIVNNVELLTPVVMNVTTCPANGGTQYLPPPPTFSSITPLGRLTHLASLAVHRLSVAARGLVTPREAYAIDVGMGGEALFFSTFAVVDPLSKADLALSALPAPQFSLSTTTFAGGEEVPSPTWSVTNIGSGTSAPFTSSVIIATDSLLSLPVTTYARGGAGYLVPGSSFGYSTFTLTMPTSPGTYFVGVKILPTGPDSSAANNLVSIRVEVGGFDLAVQPGFSVSPVSIVQGVGSVSTSAWTVKNIGSSTAGPFNSVLALATDSTLQSGIVQWPSVGGSSSLAAGASLAYGANTVAISPCVSPGTYFVGPRVFPAAGDAVASNNQTSRRITVTADAAPTGQSAGSATWTGSGPGIVTEQVNPHCATLSYNNTPSGYSYQTWTFTTYAVASGSYTFNWNYAGLHSWFAVTQHLEAFANGPSGEIVVQLVNVYVPGSAGDFNYSGTTTLPLTAGYTWGVRPAGQHFDSSQILMGTVRITDLAPVSIL